MSEVRTCLVHIQTLGTSLDLLYYKDLLIYNIKQSRLVTIRLKTILKCIRISDKYVFGSPDIRQIRFSDVQIWDTCLSFNLP